MLQCEDCGKESEDVVEVIDPYMDDVCDEIDYITVCPECLDERAMSI